MTWYPDGGVQRWPDHVPFPEPPESELRKAPVIRDNCGTAGGYRSHRVRMEEACADCRTAEVAAVMRRRVAKTGSRSSSA